MSKEIKYASFLIRGIALVWDSLMPMSISLAIILGLSIISSKGKINLTNENVFDFIVLSYLLLIIFIIYLTNKYGQTTGEKLTGIKVFSLTGDKLSTKQIIIRTLALFTTGIITWLFIFFKPYSLKRQTGWDYISKTYVAKI